MSKYEESLRDALLEPFKQALANKVCEPQMRPGQKLINFLLFFSIETFQCLMVHMVITHY